MNRLNISSIKNDRKKKTFLCLGIAVFLVLIPLAFTPVSSDDFIYVTNNTEWSNIGWRYLNWSGRIVADSFSLILLQLPSFIYKFLKAIIWVSLIWLISCLPSILNKKYTWEIRNFVILFLLYWIANPNLGQTSLWTVGFSNYLLTNFFIVAYFALVFYLKDRKLKNWQFIAIPILGLLAGNSNENTSIIVVLLTFVFLLIEKRKHVFLLGLPFTIIGTLSLLLSPGQNERLQHPAFQVAREQSIFRRLWNYFSTSLFFDTFKSFSWVFLIFVLIGFVYFFRKQFPQKRNAIYSMIFLFAAIIANAAFGGSYVFPVALRSLNGALVLFLISTAFILDDLVYGKVPVYKKSTSYIIAFLCTPFFLGYSYVTKSVISLQGQFNIREETILSGKKNKLKKIYIPNFYVGKLYNPSDSIDLYQGDIDNYYGLDKSIPIVRYNKDFSFDYNNKKLVDAEQIPLNVSFGKNVNLKALNIFPDKRSLNTYSINLTFDNSLQKLYPADSTTLFIHVNWKREANPNPMLYNADTSLNNQLFVYGKYIFSSPIENIRSQDITSIDIGIYDTIKEEILTQTSVIMNNK